MKRTILVDNKYGWNRIAVLEDNSIAEVYAEQNNTNKIVGNIYLAKVINFDSRNQAAFLDIGIGVNVYLGIEDIVREACEKTKKNNKCISDYFSQGDKVIIQITKDIQGVKLPKASMNIKLSGRYLVFKPLKKMIIISNKIKYNKNMAVF